MEINIKKKKKPVWPWIIALLVVLAVIWVLYTQFGDEVQQEINNATETSSIAPSINSESTSQVMIDYEDIAYYEEVQDFINYVELSSDEEPQQNYTAKATIFLAHALSRMVDREYVGDANIETKRKELLLATERISSDSLNQSEHIKSAFHTIADLMTAMQKKDYPDLKPQVYELKKAATSIELEQIAAEQITGVNEFFLLSKIALKAISEIDTF